MIKGREKSFTRTSLLLGATLTAGVAVAAGLWASHAVAQTSAAGPFTAAQAQAGQTLFNGRCATCHDVRGEGGRADRRELHQSLAQSHHPGSLHPHQHDHAGRQSRQPHRKTRRRRWSPICCRPMAPPPAPPRSRRPPSVAINTLIGAAPAQVAQAGGDAAAPAADPDNPARRRPAVAVAADGRHAAAPVFRTGSPCRERWPNIRPSPKT